MKKRSRVSFNNTSSFNSFISEPTESKLKLVLDVNVCFRKNSKCKHTFLSPFKCVMLNCFSIFMIRKIRTCDKLND